MPFKDKKRQRSYMVTYMREYRAAQQKILNQARQQLGLSTKVRSKRRRKK